MSLQDGVARVDREICVGCMLCQSACPQGLIEAVPYAQQVVTPCASREKGAVVRDSILLPESTVGEGACVERTILNENASIAANAAVGAPGKITVIGENAVMEVDV